MHARPPPPPIRRELGVIARVAKSPADPAAVAADCGLTRQGAAALLSALAGFDLLELGDDGCFRSAYSGLLQLVELLRPQASLQPVLRGRPPPANAATITGAESSIRVSSPRSGLSCRPSVATGRGRRSSTPSGSYCARAAAGSIPIQPSAAGSAKQASRIPAGTTSPARFRSL
jgi:hypothetical protein